ncbi:MAG: ABC transporter permease subunit [Phycisphaeraceae bacterium]|nr:ABC transporter permease subunit [Phycisphaeraceae bacterium]
MQSKPLAIILVGIGLAIILWRWGDLTDIIQGPEHLREHEVVFWTSSGSPEFERMLVREFMRQHRDIQVRPNFRETGGLDDIVFASFLSGNPPDIMGVDLAQLREMVGSGMIRPMDDLLQWQLEQEPNFLENRVGGEDSLVRFFVNPSDPVLANIQRRPEEAARVLAMHGRIVGFRGVTSFDTLTYNRRIFREAHQFFVDQGRADELEEVPLVDESGNARPPRTWYEMFRAAELISEYGRARAAAQGQTHGPPYGLVIQGQRPADLMRGIGPLAATAGSRGFDFTTGQYRWDDPAILGAFEMLHRLHQRQCILPGTQTRHYEDVRVELASGNAAMLIDGWHAALIGVERVGWAREDIGSAPIPVPDEKTEELLGMELGRGVAHRGGAGAIQAITSLSDSPRQAWMWMQYGQSPEVQRFGTMRGSMPGTYEVAEFLNDPEKRAEWFPMPYQPDAWRVFNEHSQLWPEPPAHDRVRATRPEDLLRGAFFETGMNEGVLQGLRDFSDQANESVRQRIEEGRIQPLSHWRFEDWDATRAAEFFRRQQMAGVDDEAMAQVEALRAQLPEHLRDLEPQELAFKPGTSPLIALWIPGMMSLVIAGWIGWLAFRKHPNGQSRLKPTLRDARRHWEAYIFVIPAMLALFTFVLYPAIYQFYLALHSGSGLGALRYVGIDNFARVFGDKTFWHRVLPNTLVYVVGVTAVQVSLGLFLAMMLNLPLRANRVFRIMFFIPLVTSLAVISVIFLGLLGGTDSALNEVLSSLGLDRLPYWLGLVEEPGRAVDWLGHGSTALYMVMVVAIWNALPFTIILFLAGLQSISPDLYEAARVDGAGPAQRFVHITIPELSPILIVILFNSIIGAARAFGSVWVLTEGGPEHRSEVAATYIFKWGFTRPDNQDPNLGYASSLGIVYALLLGTVIAVNVWFIASRWRKRLALEQQARKVQTEEPGLPDPIGAPTREGNHG